MLVLSRKKNESIVINGNIVITVAEIRGDKVRIGVEAPKEVPVWRGELYVANKESNAKNEPGKEEDLLSGGQQELGEPSSSV